MYTIPKLQQLVLTLTALLLPFNKTLVSVQLLSQLCIKKLPMLLKYIQQYYKILINGIFFVQ